MKSVKKSWGKVVIDQDNDGSIRVSLENSKVLCEYSLVDCGSEEGFEGSIRRFINKTAKEDQAQAPGGDIDGRIDAAAWRGAITKAYISDVEDESMTVHLDFTPIKGSIARQEVTIYRDRSWIKVHYIDWLVNIVDIAHPGGTDQGQYQFYGAENWKRPYMFYENIYFCRYADDIGYMNITEVDDPEPISYKGWFIMGVFNPANGRGYGRVAPVEAVDIIKLLFEDRNCGFELFPYYNREHEPFSIYLFVVTGGAEGVIATGKRIVDDIHGG
jgi:hypothetical protein